MCIIIMCNIELINKICLYYFPGRNDLVPYKTVIHVYIEC